jgi:GNAT superfamily N-acetyltransferase
MSTFVRLADDKDADAIAQVHVASWHATYRGILPDEQIAARTVEVRRAQWAACIEEADRITLVACDEDGGVQGFASAILLDGSDNGFQSYLQTLYLWPDKQNRGIGRQLLHELVTRLRAAGAKNMALRTLRRNPARGFYERLGARPAPEGIAHDAGLFDDVVYAFDDLQLLE